MLLHWYVEKSPLDPSVVNRSKYKKTVSAEPLFFRKLKVSDRFTKRLVFPVLQATTITLFIVITRGGGEATTKSVI